MAKNQTLKITEMDRYLFGQGTHYEIYKLMGAHPTKEKTAFISQYGLLVHRK